MKIIAHLSFILFLGLSACGGGGDGKTDPETPTAKSVYVSGNILGITPDITIGGYWKDGVWNELSNPAWSTGYTRVTGLTVEGNDVYAAGEISDAKGKWGSAGYWKNGNWYKLDNIYGDYQGSAEAIEYYDGKIYAAGRCVNGEYDIAGFWVSDGSSSKWTALGEPGSKSDSYVTDMAVSNGMVYVLGLITTEETYSVGYWTYDLSKPTVNPSWVDLPNSVDPASEAEVNSILVSDGNVYVGGGCRNGSNSVAGFWISDGSKPSWQGLTDASVGKYDETVYSIAFVDGKVCAAGRSYNPAGGYFIAGYWKYDGSAYKWNGLTNPQVPTDSADVSSITISDGDIYLAASLIKSSLRKRSMGSQSASAGYFKNGTWVPLTTNHDTTEYPNSMTGTIVVK